MHTLRRLLFLSVLVCALFTQQTGSAQQPPARQNLSGSSHGPVAGASIGALLGTALAGTTCYGLLAMGADSGSGSFAPYSVACGVIGSLTIAASAYAGGSLNGGGGSFGFTVLGAALPALVATAGLIPAAFESDAESGALFVSGALLFLVGTPLGALLGYTLSDVAPESGLRISPTVSRTDRHGFVFGVSGVF